MNFEKKTNKEMEEQLKKDSICFVKIKNKVYLLDSICDDIVYVSDADVDKKPYDIAKVQAICSLKSHPRHDEIIKLILANRDG